jgi:hypothetical protein
MLWNIIIQLLHKTHTIHFEENLCKSPKSHITPPPPPPMPLPSNNIIILPSKVILKCPTQHQENCKNNNITSLLVAECRIMKKSSCAAFTLVKGQCNHEIFEFRFFRESVSSNTIRAVSNFFENSRRYLQLMANLLQVSLTSVANLPRVSTTPAVPVAKFAPGVIDTSSKPPAQLIPVVHLDLQISP